MIKKTQVNYKQLYTNFNKTLNQMKTYKLTNYIIILMSKKITKVFLKIKVLYQKK